MNLATILIGVVLFFSYLLAIRHVCKNGACADCGLQGVCPIHTLQDSKKPKPAELEAIRKSSPRPDIRVTIHR
ncbi:MULTISPECIES: hypothetical protein [unclassified Sporolactobacillus]|uniref:hypothetical protein n=1 Tax=unclassified Sporolactobacillus TaxID=2628533 RepID=UPI002367C204|nr:hypothetical protein [Sporolactobacillus sp. CQH2019]MDD9150328.1 hypothetical protein [Sporolactobacillus sp. CQH2019]